MSSATFSISSTPELYFGAGKISLLPSLVKSFGNHVLLVTGAHSFVWSERGQNTINGLIDIGFEVSQFTIAKEPTPDMIDEAVKKYHDKSIDVVVSIGGGSVLDGGKAISAMLKLNGPVKDYLEGVGTKNHPGTKTPFFAIPTTAGTGSEATKNAVISEVGQNGFKKSLRHNNFVPDIAVIDPLLTVSCPPAQTAASGMDAFTQLLESYLSTNANPVTDAMALEGLHRVSVSLMNAYQDGSHEESRSDMSMAAYLSGVTLANAGLGLVHGFASSVGGYFDIPHGVICSALMGPSNRLTVRRLRADKNHEQALIKYATVGKMFGGNQNKSQDYHIDFLLAWIDTWTSELNIPKLSTFGITSADFERIASATDNKNNPAKLTKEEMQEALALACRTSHL